MRTVWTITIDGDELSTTVRNTEAEIYTYLREQWAVDKDTPDEDLVQSVVDEYGVTISGPDEHELPEPVEVRTAARSVWEEVVRKQGRCKDKMCDCQKVEVPE